MVCSLNVYSRITAKLVTTLCLWLVAAPHFILKLLRSECSVQKYLSLKQTRSVFYWYNFAELMSELMVPGTSMDMHVTTARLSFSLHSQMQVQAFIMYNHFTTDICGLVAHSYITKSRFLISGGNWLDVKVWMLFFHALVSIMQARFVPTFHFWKFPCWKNGLKIEHLKVFLQTH
jgi:hypothetical protein